MVTFIEGGGLEKSRAVEREKLANERRKLESERQMRSAQPDGVMGHFAAPPPDHEPAAGGLARLLGFFLS